jgi:hypothetical protein
MKKSGERIVEPELLDELPPQDQRALRSRVDLLRLNKWMKHPQIMAHALRENLNGHNACRIVELGAGDGHFLLSVARRLKPQWKNTDATLVDRLDTFDSKIRDRFNDLDWHVRVETATASEWLQQLPANTAEAIITNLFLHQFHIEDLTEMLRLAARTTKTFIALEPRRSWLPKFCGHFLWCIGCGPVTRNDAGISIRAGFLGHELSAIWPDKERWELVERPAGLFSHLFIARRKD